MIVAVFLVLVRELVISGTTVTAAPVDDCVWSYTVLLYNSVMI